MPLLLGVTVAAGEFVVSTMASVVSPSGLGLITSAAALLVGSRVGGVYSVSLSDGPCTDAAPLLVRWSASVPV